MKLVSSDDGKIGLHVLLPTGPHAIDIGASVGVFTPHDPLSNGLLNGSFKDGGNWSEIVKHWTHLKWPLKRLANIAAICPEHPLLVLRPLTEQQRQPRVAILAIEITDTEDLTDIDPTGRRAMQLQLMSRSDDRTSVTPGSPVVAQVIDFLFHRDHDARK
ncbi:hypothetical protein [Bradyrhizobium erythrophlei]|uniref:Uncharacterized protein n=1 Tax=Bradyrhizobium erythrophlei TaxID=1437360 RepID=A0A1M7U3V9_9BRAD|nr:hypothetical protein [Bradyrhizobium erythrophlei]SHN77636.1 hypothetical protein SAMN05444170_3476 [Bradyrhizobium erythrophlei]